METHTELLEALGVKEVAESLGLDYYRVANWKYRNRIPAEWWVEISFLKSFQNLKLGGLKGLKALKKGK